MLTIDGSAGEGGGQVLRTSLALALVTGTPFRIDRIRGGRARPGLMRQHLTAVLAAAEVGGARVEGAAVGSASLVFRPGPIRAGDYAFSVGTAGSATLVLQTVLPALLRADGPSTLVLEGGTHNPHAPPFDFLARAFVPLVERMGAGVTVELERAGFYPAGGGRFTATVTPGPLRPVTLHERGATVHSRAVALLSNLPGEIGKRELAVLASKLPIAEEHLQLRFAEGARGPGNALLVEWACEHVTEVFVGFGEKGVRAEAVAERLAKEVRTWLGAGVPVGTHLADQLLLPMALAGGGSFRTLPPSRHLLTNVEVIQRFVDVPVRIEAGDADCVVTVG